MRMMHKNILLVLGILLVGFFIYLMNTDTEPEIVDSIALEDEMPASTIPDPVPASEALEVQPAVESVVLEAVIETGLETEVDESFEELLAETTEEATEAIEVVELVEEAVVIEFPSLNNSDDFVRSQLSKLSTGSELLGLMVSEELIRKFVIFTVSVNEGFLSSAIPLQPMTEEFRVKRGRGDGHFVMVQQSFMRFDYLIDTLIAIDNDAAVSLYKLLSPLFQEAYAEMGYPNRRFDDVLLGAIDNVLFATNKNGILQLIRPSVMYRYVNTDIEALNQVEKLLLRLGHENAENLQQKLKAIRSVL